MAPLTQEEVNNLKHELGALTDTEDKKMHLGMEAYEALFGAHPNYIPMFSRLQGQNAGTFKGTEGHKYYGRTLITDLLRFVNAGANDGDFKKLIDESAQQHQLRNVNKQQFLSGEPVFCEFFKKHLKQHNNGEAMAKLLHCMMPAVAEKLH